MLDPTQIWALQPLLGPDAVQIGLAQVKPFVFPLLFQELFILVLSQINQCQPITYNISNTWVGSIATNHQIFRTYHLNGPLTLQIEVLSQ